MPYVPKWDQQERERERDGGFVLTAVTMESAVFWDTASYPMK
jgi:hypothetical protein